MSVPQCFRVEVNSLKRKGRLDITEEYTPYIKIILILFRIRTAI
jgi:hypothetical protein